MLLGLKVVRFVCAGFGEVVWGGVLGWDGALGVAWCIGVGPMDRTGYNEVG